MALSLLLLVTFLSFYELDGSPLVSKGIIGSISPIPPDATVELYLSELGLVCTYPSFSYESLLPVLFPHVCIRDRNRCIYDYELSSTNSSHVQFVFPYTPQDAMDDGAVFTCSNATGSVTLNLKYPPKVADVLGATFDEKSGIWMITGYSEGETAPVAVIVNAKPPVNAKGVLIRGGSNTPNVSISGSEVSLNFTNLTGSNSGIYGIQFSNYLGIDNIILRLLVNYGPKFRYGNATFMKLVQPNLTLVLDCSLEGSSYPSALILYSTTANEVSNAKYNSTTNRITITNAVAGNSGNYTCIATNGLKTVTLQYTMDIGNPPNEVISFKLNYTEGLFTIKHTIMGPHDTSIIGYTVVLSTSYPPHTQYVLTRAQSYLMVPLPEETYFNMDLVPNVNRYWITMQVSNKYLGRSYGYLIGWLISYVQFTLDSNYTFVIIKNGTTLH